MGVLQPAEHLARAQRHRVVGEALANAGDEWAAVCFFYSAYHTVKAALLTDVVFDDPTSCHARDPDLLPEDRYVTRHKGRKTKNGPREWGVNELVLLLYPGAVGKYERLHQMSIAVRYQAGLTASIATVRTCFDEFTQLCHQGVLTSAVVPNPR